jgi:hypothetical protein
MTDAELETLYKLESQHSHEAALRAIYGLGLVHGSRGLYTPDAPPTAPRREMNSTGTLSQKGDSR